jgi:hypothetical protein
MPKSVELCQLVSRAISHTTLNIPKIRYGNRWRNINNAHLVENQNRINGHDHYEDAIFRARRIMEDRGWNTEIADRCKKAFCTPVSFGNFGKISAKIYGRNYPIKLTISTESALFRTLNYR